MSEVPLYPRRSRHGFGSRSQVLGLRGGGVEREAIGAVGKQVGGTLGFKVRVLGFGV